MEKLRDRTRLKNQLSLIKHNGCIVPKFIQHTFFPVHDQEVIWKLIQVPRKKNGKVSFDQHGMLSFDQLVMLSFDQLVMLSFDQQLWWRFQMINMLWYHSINTQLDGIIWSTLQKWSYHLINIVETKLSNDQHCKYEDIIWSTLQKWSYHLINII